MINGQMSGFYDVSIVEEVPTRLIRPSTRPLRREPTSLDDLIESIRQHGLLQPIIARPYTDWFEVVAGNRRFAACKSLRWLKIPIVSSPLLPKKSHNPAIAEPETSSVTAVTPEKFAPGVPSA